LLALLLALFTTAVSDDDDERGGNAGECQAASLQQQHPVKA
jgi:hypothetical protein